MHLGKITWYGASVLVHWSTLVPVVLLAMIAITNPIYGALFVGSYISIIFAHEYGHAFVAHRLGYRVHSIGITFWHGWCRHEQPDTKWEDALIAWGGVAAQVLLAIPALILAFVLGGRDWAYFTPIIVFLGFFNLAWALANLLPGDDTDGRLAWGIVPLFIEDRRMRKAAEKRRSKSTGK